MFVDQNQRRINIYAPFETADGTHYANMRDPAVREMLGVVEIPDPVPPEDFSDMLYFRTEQDTAPYVVYTRKPDEMISQAEQALDNAAALAYLRETDWYVTRFSETGAPIPDEVKQLRQEARDKIKH